MSCPSQVHRPGRCRRAGPLARAGGPRPMLRDPRRPAPRLAWEKRARAAALPPVQPAAGVALRGNREHPARATRVKPASGSLAAPKAEPHHDEAPWGPPEPKLPKTVGAQASKQLLGGCWA